MRPIAIAKDCSHKMESCDIIGVLLQSTQHTTIGRGWSENKLIDVKYLKPAGGDPLLAVNKGGPLTCGESVLLCRTGELRAGSGPIDERDNAVFNVRVQEEGGISAGIIVDDKVIKALNSVKLNPLRQVLVLVADECAHCQFVPKCMRAGSLAEEPPQTYVGANVVATWAVEKHTGLRIFEASLRM